MAASLNFRILKTKGKQLYSKYKEDEVLPHYREDNLLRCMYKHFCYLILYYESKLTNHLNHICHRGNCYLL